MFTERVSIVPKKSWDLDGVVILSSVAVAEAASNLLNTPIVPSDIISDDYLFHFGRESTGSEDMGSRAHALWFDTDVLRTSPPNPAALKVIKICHSLGISQVAVTSRRPYLYESTLSWLDEQLPFIDWKQSLHLRSPHQYENGDFFKARKNRELNVFHHSDDMPNTLRHVLENVTSCRGQLVNQPWNTADHSLDQLRVNPSDVGKMCFSIISARLSYSSSR